MSVDSNIIIIIEIVSIKVCSPTYRGILFESNVYISARLYPGKKIDQIPQRPLLVKHGNACPKVKTRLNRFSDLAQLILA